MNARCCPRVGIFRSVKTLNKWPKN
jgi:hypothetical protein